MNYLILLLLGISFFINLIPPPGTVFLEDNKFIDKRLITYGDYEEFLSYIKRNKGHNCCENLIPKDTSVTFRGKNLWRNEKFIDYPIIGLEKRLIVEYCQWRSDIVNSWKSIANNRKCNFEYWDKFDEMDPQNKLRIIYSLPSESDLVKYKPPKEKYWLNELTDTGSYTRKISKQISNKNLNVFRCIATYENVE